MSAHLTQPATAEAVLADYSAEKALATLTAQAARAGYEVHPLSDGSYLVCRWNLCRACPDMRTLSNFLCMLGVLR